MATEFTPEQRNAIQYRGLDACVVAGPGSGKTTVLVERYRTLIEQHAFDPNHILAITFTEKAAANMKAKLAALFRHNPVRLRDLESSSWVSTIHGFCMRLLRENAIAAGMDPRFSVLSPRESDRMQWECLQGALDEITELRRTETLELIEALHSPRLATELKDIYDAVRSAGLSIDDVRAMPSPAPEPPPIRIAAELRELVRQWPVDITPNQRTEKARLLEWCLSFESGGERSFVEYIQAMDKLDLNLQRVPRKFSASIKEFRQRLEVLQTAAVDRYAAPFRAMIFDVLARFDEEYRNRKNTQSRVDFNDLERHAIALLKGHPDIKSRVQKQFRQIMLDEFQDINEQQADLISLLRSENVFFGVGDRNQSIYGFRHARPEIFAAYQTEVAAQNAHAVELLHNFRSREAILRCVRAVMASKDGIDDRDLIAGMTFAGKEEPSVEVLKVGDPSDDKDAASDREAAWIAHRILALCGSLQLGVPGETRAAGFRDFAVLCRSGESMLPILAAFERAGIPYVCGRRVSYLLSREGLDITALLHTIANPRDSISLATVLRSPLVRISDEGLLRLRLSARSLTGGLNIFAAEHATDLGESDAVKLTAFCRHLERWRSDQPIVPLDLLISRVLRDCEVDWAPATTPGSNIAGANIESFLHLARTTGASMDLPSFLQEIESLADAAGTESDLSDEDQGNCVQVMTAHAAKGLEFNVTIVAAMDRGPRRESGPVTFTREHGLGVKWRNPASDDGKDELKDSWAEENKLVASQREKEEENRLLYVAMTRAAEHLILSYSHGKNKPSNWARLVDSYFGLQDAGVSAEPRREERDGFSASVFITDSDPPRQAHSSRDSAGADVETVQLPAMLDRHETAVTVTSLTTFGACPRKYYLQRSLGWNNGRFRRFDPEEIEADQPDEAANDTDAAEAGDLSASLVGSAVHEILAGAEPAREIPEAKQLAQVFLKSDLGRRAAAASISSRVAREWAFIAEIDGTIVRGTIDLWFEEDGELHVVDYKTDAVTAADARARGTDYVPQLAFYALALERAFGKRPKRASLHFLRPNTVVGVALDDATIDAARRLIASVRHAQNSLNFELNEGSHCRSCQFYRSLCPAGRQTGGRHNED